MEGSLACFVWAVLFRYNVLDVVGRSHEHVSVRCTETFGVRAPRGSNDATDGGRFFGA